MRSSAYIRWFQNVSLDDRDTVGGKGGSLGELTHAGIAVPSGFVVTTAAFERFLDLLEKDLLEKEDPIRRQVEALSDCELEELTALSTRLRARLEQAPLHDDVCAEITEAYTELCGDDLNRPLAVRSSATAEDAEDASFAGLQDTYLRVAGAPSILKSVRSCWASLYSAPSIAYRRKHRMAEDGVAMAVVVQRMVDARAAGVMFTRSPLTGDRSVITIEATWGLGSAAASGEVTPDRFVVGKITGEISVREISDKHIQHIPASGSGVQEAETPQELRRAPSLNDNQLALLRDIGRKVERHYGRPQDIEWAIDRSGEIFVLQSRPETVWSSKDAAPVAKPAENPLQHLMNIFGGRR